jgi:hypothetical protein
VAILVANFVGIGSRGFGRPFIGIEAKYLVLQLIGKAVVRELAFTAEVEILEAVSTGTRLVLIEFISVKGMG